MLLLWSSIGAASARARTADSWLEARLLSEGRPLAQCRVSIEDQLQLRPFAQLDSNDRGLVRFDRLQPGRYALEAVCDGFVTSRVEEIELLARAVKKLELDMVPGRPSSLTVTTAPVLDTTSVNRVLALDSELLQWLPGAGDVTGLLPLLPTARSITEQPVSAESDPAASEIGLVPGALAVDTRIERGLSLLAPQRSAISDLWLGVAKPSGEEPASGDADVMILLPEPAAGEQWRARVAGSWQDGASVARSSALRSGLDGDPSRRSTVLDASSAGPLGGSERGARVQVLAGMKLDRSRLEGRGLADGSRLVTDRHWADDVAHAGIELDVGGPSGHSLELSVVTATKEGELDQRRSGQGRTAATKERDELRIAAAWEHLQAGRRHLRLGLRSARWDRHQRGDLGFLPRLRFATDAPSDVPSADAGPSGSSLLQLDPGRLDDERRRLRLGASFALDAGLHHLLLSAHWREGEIDVDAAASAFEVVWARQFAGASGRWGHYFAHSLSGSGSARIVSEAVSVEDQLRTRRLSLRLAARIERDRGSLSGAELHTPWRTLPRFALAVDPRADGETKLFLSHGRYAALADELLAETGVPSLLALESRVYPLDDADWTAVLEADAGPGSLSGSHDAWLSDSLAFTLLDGSGRELEPREVARSSLGVENQLVPGFELVAVVDHLDLERALQLERRAGGAVLVDRNGDEASVCRRSHLQARIGARLALTRVRSHLNASYGEVDRAAVCARPAVLGPESARQRSSMLGAGDLAAGLLDRQLRLQWIGQRQLGERWAVAWSAVYTDDMAPEVLNVPVLLTQAGSIGEPMMVTYRSQLIDELEGSWSRVDLALTWRREIALGRRDAVLSTRLSVLNLLDQDAALTYGSQALVSPLRLDAIDALSVEQLDTLVLTSPELGSPEALRPLERQSERQFVLGVELRL